MLIPMAIAAATMPWGQSANYGLFVVFLTPIIVILLDIAAPADSGVVTARLVDTIVGSGIVLIFGYLLWPRTWRSSLEGPLQQVVMALDAFVEAAFGTSGEDRRQARRRTFRALTELQNALQRQLAEPPPLRTRAAAWWPLIVQMERTADSVIEAAVAVDSGASPPAAGQVATLRHVIQTIGDPAAGSHRDVPDDLASGVLASLAQDVDAAHRQWRQIEQARHSVAD